MSEWDKPIISLDDAEKYFRAMGCSSFYMAREYPDRYDEYRALKVSQSTETAWRRADFHSQLGSLIDENAEPTDLWSRHSSLADLADMIEDIDVAQQLLHVTQIIAPRVPNETRILVAETLIGRASDFSEGPIALCYTLGDPELADEFKELVKVFCDGTSAPEGGPPIEERKSDVIEKVNMLSAESVRKARESFEKLLSRIQKPWWKFW